MKKLDGADFRQEFRKLQEEHRRGMEAGDVEALNKVQVALAKLMKRRGLPRQ